MKTILIKIKKILINKKSIVFAVPYLFCLAIIISFLGIKNFERNKNEMGNVITKSTLMKTLDIMELSTAKFTYKGIAEIYEDENQEKIKCYILYHAEVKAGINMKDIDFDIDNDEKTVKPLLPEITIDSNPVVYPNLSFIPENINIELKEALAASKEDVIVESNSSPELKLIATENLKSILEGLLAPILESEDYQIIWE